MSIKGFSAVEAIVGLSLLLIVAGGGYVLFNMQEPKIGTDNSATKTSTPTQSASPTSIPDDVYRGWKEYRNDELGISFRYPEHWIAPDETSVGLFNYYVHDDARSAFLGGLQLDGGKDSNDLIRRPLFLFSVFNNSSSLSVKEWLERYDINTRKSPTEIPVVKYERAVAGRDVYFNGTEQVYFENNERIYALGLGYTTYDLYPEEGFQEIFDHLLDSIKLY